MDKLFLVVLLLTVLQATYCSPAKRNWDNEFKEEDSTVSTTEETLNRKQDNYLLELENESTNEGKDDDFNDDDDDDKKEDIDLDNLAENVEKELKHDEESKEEFQSSPYDDGSEQDIVEGDIKLTPVQAAIFKESGWDGLVKSEAWKRNHGVWPRKIPYTISGLKWREKIGLQRSFYTLHRHTCLRFVPHTNQSDYLKFVNDGGCWSAIGKVGGAQKISLSPRCGYGEIPAHEIMHALGHFHEQSRSDRDTYVKIHYENIMDGAERQFQKQSTSDSQGLPYDYESLMHYGKYDFSKNGKPTIETLRPPNAEIGQRVRLSLYDKMQINIRYCPERMVRLVNGNSPNEGRVEVNWGGQWGTVCNNNFDISDGNVICKYLGYSKAIRVFNRGAHFGRKRGFIFFDDMNCSGHEPTPFHCPKRLLFGTKLCNRGRGDAGVICQIKPADAVRLVNGTKHAGRVEVYIEGHGWGTVCDDYFGAQEARVICRQLGYRDETAFRYYRRARYGQGTLPILLANLRCTGNEKDVRECRARPVGSHNCEHDEDASVKCM